MPRNQRGQCIRFDPAVWDRVQVEATARGLSVNHFVTRLIAEGLDRLIPADEFTLVRRSEPAAERRTGRQAVSAGKRRLCGSREVTTPEDRQEIEDDPAFATDGLREVEPMTDQHITHVEHDHAGWYFWCEADVFEKRADLTEHRERLFRLIEDTPWLDWQLLTKRPENIARLAPDRWNAGFPENVWIGTTVEDQQRAKQRIPHLLTTPCEVRFLSCEPLLGPVDLSRWLGLEWSEIGECWGIDMFSWLQGEWGPARGISWVIVGGESGPHHRPLDLDHARTLRDQCLAAVMWRRWWSSRSGRLRTGRRW